MSEYDEALAGLFGVPRSEHLWCHDDPQVRNDLQVVLQGFADHSIRSPELMARLRGELSCLECVQAFHGLAHGAAAGTAGFMLDWSTERLLGALAQQARGQPMQPATLAALVELLNFPMLLARASLMLALESTLALLLADATVSFRQDDRCGGLLLLCASGDERVRAWALGLVTSLGVCVSQDDLEYVVRPALTVMCDAWIEQRVQDRTGGAAQSFDGRVVFDGERFFGALWTLLRGCDAQWVSALARLDAWLYGQLFQMVLCRVDERANEVALWALALLLRNAVGPDVWIEDATDDAVTMGPVAAVEMLFGKGCSVYEQVESDVAMEHVLMCLRFVCQRSPVGLRAQVQDHQQFRIQ